MNRQVLICRSFLEDPKITQRELSELLKTSLGTTNALIRECTEAGDLAEKQVT